MALRSLGFALPAQPGAGRGWPVGGAARQVQLPAVPPGRAARPSCTWTAGVGVVAGMTATAVAQRRSRRRSCAARATVVDVELIDASSAALDDILARFETEVPVRSQFMEYARVPKKSTLASCGIAELEAGGPEAADFLVDRLTMRGLDRDHAEISAAVLLLMLGALDEAHNLVTPHTSTVATTFGGQPRIGSAVVRDARYCQVIIHRMEGENRGPNGLGFQDSNLWIGKAFPGDGEEHPVFASLRETFLDLSSAGCPDQARSMLKGVSSHWKPQAFNRLCADALEEEDPELLAFCGKIQAKELRLLFDHVMAAGTSGGVSASGGTSSGSGVIDVGKPPQASNAGVSQPAGAATPGTAPDLEDAMNDPQFVEMAKKLQANPELFQLMAQNDPNLKKLVQEDPVLQKAMENPEAIKAAMAAVTAGGGRPRTGQEQLTKQDEEVIERLRLCNLSTDRNAIVSTYLACGKDEKLASQVLMGTL